MIKNMKWLYQHSKMFQEYIAAYPVFKDYLEENVVAKYDDELKLFLRIVRIVARCLSFLVFGVTIIRVLFFSFVFVFIFWRPFVFDVKQEFDVKQFLEVEHKLT